MNLVLMSLSLVLISLCCIAAMPLVQHKVMASQMIDQSRYTEIAANTTSKSSASSSARTQNISLATNATVGNNKSTINLKFASKTFPITYQISGSGNKLTNITVESDNTTLLLNVASQTNGILKIQLPRNLIDSKKEGNQDDPYAIFQDGQYRSGQEISNNTRIRTLAIDFDKGTDQIEISGTRMLPEFGSAYTVFIITTIIILIIVTSTRYRQLRLTQVAN